MTSPTPGAPSTAPSPDLVDAVQAALGAEHAAVWCCGLAAAFLPPDDAAALAETADGHRARRDATERTLTDLGAVPRAAEAAYLAPAPVLDAPSARALLVAAEADCAAAWRYALEVGEPGSAARTTALDGLTAAAVRGTRWRAAAGGATPTEAFPGTG